MKNPITVVLTYANDADIGTVVDHLNSIGKSHGAPHIQIANPDRDEYVRAVVERAQGRGISINQPVTDPKDRARYTDDYDTDPTAPIVMGNTQGATSIEEQREAQVNDNLVASTEDERSPPGTPTAGREARAEKSTTRTPERENPGFSADTGETVAAQVEAEAQAKDPTTEARPIGDETQP